MNDGPLSERRSFAGDSHEYAIPTDEATEVARILLRAGVDHASALWLQLLELATQRACDWSERSTAAGAPLGMHVAARVGLRAIAAEVLSVPAQADGAHAAAEACLGVCAEIEAELTRTPARPRRWGEGALPQAPRRSGLLERGAARC